MSIMLHLEGMDLAGKSTIAMLIAKEGKKHWQVNDKRLTTHNDIYEFAWGKSKSQVYSSEIMGYMYLAALLNDIDQFHLDVDLIQDSLLALRSLNYYIAVQPNCDLEQLYRTALLRHPQPDKSFYLTASIEARKKRLAKRIQTNPTKITNMDMLIMKNPDLFRRIDNSLQNITVEAFNSTVIDTSEMSEKEVFDLIQSQCGFPL